MTNEKITYKKAVLSDVPLIHQLAVEIWHEYYPNIISRQQIDYMLDLMYSESTLKKQMEAGYDFYIVYAHHMPAGYMGTHQEQNQCWYIDKFYLKKEIRGNQIGKTFFKHVENILINKGISVLRLYVNRENYKSINFYFKCGFTIECTIDKPIGNGFYMNDFIMIKKYTT
jgi:ribosomal protein S18 acetylase RimI-like enzyme